MCDECVCLFFFFFKQKTAYEMRISDWSSDVCSSDLAACAAIPGSLAFRTGDREPRPDWSAGDHDKGHRQDAEARFQLPDPRFNQLEPAYRHHGEVAIREPG